MTELLGWWEDGPWCRLYHMHWRSAAEWRMMVSQRSSSTFGKKIGMCQMRSVEIAAGASIVFCLTSMWLSRHSGTKYFSVLVNVLSSWILISVSWPSVFDRKEYEWNSVFSILSQIPMELRAVLRPTETSTCNTVAPALCKYVTISSQECGFEVKSTTSSLVRWLP